MSARVNIDNHVLLQGLELADMSIAETGQQDIDVLIGSDYYFNIVSGDVIRGSSGPVAVSSMFGWVLSGPTSAKEAREKLGHRVIRSTREATCVTVRWWRVPGEHSFQ